MKDDAIAQLSDQVMALTARMQEIERNNKSKMIKKEAVNVAYQLLLMDVRYNEYKNYYL
jgi:hypothetical protein